MSPLKETFLFSFQTIAQLQKGADALHSEKQNLEKKFEDSTKEAKGNSSRESYATFIVIWTKFVTSFTFLQRALIK